MIGVGGSGLSHAEGEVQRGARVGVEEGWESWLAPSLDVGARLRNSRCTQRLPCRWVRSTKSLRSRSSVWAQAAAVWGAYVTRLLHYLRRGLVGSGRHWRRLATAQKPHPVEIDPLNPRHPAIMATKLAPAPFVNAVSLPWLPIKRCTCGVLCD